MTPPQNKTPEARCLGQCSEPERWRPRRLARRRPAAEWEARTAASVSSSGSGFARFGGGDAAVPAGEDASAPSKYAISMIVEASQSLFGDHGIRGPTVAALS